jgi:hypothetical protein
MAIQRGPGQSTRARFSVGLNVILIGSKNMSETQQDAAMTVAAVRVLIVDASNPENVLVDETAEAKVFSTGSVGYGVNTRENAFHQA